MVATNLEIEELDFAVEFLNHLMNIKIVSLNCLLYFEIDLSKIDLWFDLLTL